MSIESEVAALGITEVLHFTTNHGLAGILASHFLKARAQLTKDKYLEHIYKHNCKDRSRDAAWHDYVNLSISHINADLFGIASGNWHRDIQGWWCVLAFDPSILSHDGVYFTTTNNMYSGVRRERGESGFKALFVAQITRWSGKTVRRAAGWPNNRPTCPYAEVLYPVQVDLEYLRTIYVRESSHIDDIAGMCGGLDLPMPNCTVSQEVFQP